MGFMLTTSGQMEIVVHDDAAAMSKLLKLPVAKRLGALATMRGISEFDEPAMKQLRQIHERGDGFRVGVDDPRYPAALARLIEADAWGQLKRDLARAWEYQQAVLPGIHHAEMVDVILTLGNPDDTVFIDRTLGYYGMGSIPGSIWMVAWPTSPVPPRPIPVMPSSVSTRIRPRRSLATLTQPSRLSGWPYQPLTSDSIE